MEFASCGQSIVLELSRYIPRESTQKTELKVDFSEVAFVAQEDAKEVALRAVARSTLSVKVYNDEIA